MDNNYNRKKKQLQREDNGQILMSKYNIDLINENEGLYEFPDLNNKIYLHFKGFHKIENLEEYKNLATIWLENNAISKIENLNNQPNMHTLFLHNNCITKIENLENCKNLRVLNLSHNMITKIENLGSLEKLSSLDISHNIIHEQQGLLGLIDAQSITNLDLSDNKFDYDEQIFDIFPQMLNLACLYLRNSQFSRNCPQYRRRMCHKNPKLKYLDERPVTNEERRLVQAWIQNGREGEQEERKKIGEEKNQKTQIYLDGIRKNQQEQQELRRKVFDKAQQEYKDELLIQNEKLEQSRKKGESMGKIKIIMEDIEILEQKIENLNFDTVKTDSHIRTQCFSTTRRENGSVKIWDRDQDEVKEIQEKFIDIETSQISKKNQELLIENQKKLQDMLDEEQQENLENIEQNKKDQNEDELNNVEQILQKNNEIQSLEWENEFDELLETLFELYEEPQIVQIELQKFLQEALQKLNKPFKIEFSKEYIIDKYEAITHRKKIIQSKSYQILINQQEKKQVQLDELD